MERTAASSSGAERYPPSPLPPGTRRASPASNRSFRSRSMLTCGGRQACHGGRLSHLGHAIDGDTGLGGRVGARPWKLRRACEEARV
jgi:hypothetical protein